MGQFLKSPVTFYLRLPEVSTGSFRPEEKRIISGRNEQKGKFGQMLIEMLPEDLPFAVFLPSEKAFQRDLRLRLDDNLDGGKADDAYAILTRSLGCRRGFIDAEFERSVLSDYSER
ncbi:hypothetical protein ACH5RR_019334 [Cinchona calisaya]|uniref:Uncharacterized protein n=1 Tax=Cinchona calisaya TaxID=153742 RepID=A0ABD2ZS63_9GENT